MISEAGTSINSPVQTWVINCYFLEVSNLAAGSHTSTNTHSKHKHTQQWHKARCSRSLVEFRLSRALLKMVHLISMPPAPRISISSVIRRSRVGGGGIKGRPRSPVLNTCHKSHIASSLLVLVVSISRPLRSWGGGESRPIRRDKQQRKG